MVQVFKTGVTHYFSMEKAKRDFGYSPEAKTLDGVVWWYRERGHGRRAQQGGLMSVLVTVAIVVLVVSLVLGFLPVVR